MAWDFTADSEIQTEVSTNLNTFADNFDAKVGEMYGKIDEMGTHWVGEDYDLFKDGCAGYKGAIEDLARSIRLYSTHFAHVSEGTVQLADTLVGIIKNMTEFCGAGGSVNGDASGGNSISGGANIPSGGANTSGNDAVDDSVPLEEGDQGGLDQQGRDSNSEQSDFGDTTQVEGGDTGNVNTTLNKDNRPIYNSGDAVKYNGTDYNVYGYVTGPDGNSMGIYEGKDGYLYYIDADGNMAHVKVNQTTYYTSNDGMSTPVSGTVDAKADSVNGSSGFGYSTLFSSYEIDGIQYKKDSVVSSGYSPEDVVGNAAGSHTTYTGVTEGRVSETTYSSMSENYHGSQVNLAGHDGSSDILAVPGNYAGFKEAVQNQQPIKLQGGHVLEYDFTGIGTKKYGENGDTYFVYHSGNYYESDDKGNILDYSYPIDIKTLLGKGLGNDTDLH